MKISQTAIHDCFVIEMISLNDSRGSFRKPYMKSAFQSLGIEFQFEEEYFSVSAKNVLRGLHFQLPPVAAAKLVTCLTGEILDAVVDLRKNSPTYLETFTIRLSGKGNQMIYIPEGLAHGFYSLEDDTTLLYLASKPFSAAHDSGIRWDSANVAWPTENPVISERDQQLVPLEQFTNPFNYNDHTRHQT